MQPHDKVSIMKKSKTYSLEDTTIRDIINARLEDLGVTRYELAHYGGINTAPSTVFRFLSGERNTFTGNVEQMLASCGLEIVATKKPTWVEA